MFWLTASQYLVGVTNSSLTPGDAEQGCQTSNTLTYQRAQKGDLQQARMADSQLAHFLSLSTKYL